VPKLTINIGVLLIVLGIASYVLTGAASATALIPSFFGLAFIGLGALAKRSESMRKHSMHAALLLAILGLGGSFGGLLAMLGALTGDSPERFGAAAGQSIMALICIFFLVAGIRSFIKARKEQE
jgi:peptidoglycan/LPS O-acetylase OafA/YrhL